MEGESWKKNHGGGIMEEESGGGVVEGESLKMSGRHLGGIHLRSSPQA